MRHLFWFHHAMIKIITNVRDLVSCTIVYNNKHNLCIFFSVVFLWAWKGVTFSCSSFWQWNIGRVTDKNIAVSFQWAHAAFNTQIIQRVSCQSRTEKPLRKSPLQLWAKFSGAEEASHLVVFFMMTVIKCTVFLIAQYHQLNPFSAGTVFIR